MRPFGDPDAAAKAVRSGSVTSAGIPVLVVVGETSAVPLMITSDGKLLATEDPLMVNVPV